MWDAVRLLPDLAGPEALVLGRVLRALTARRCYPLTGPRTYFRRLWRLHTDSHGRGVPPPLQHWLGDTAPIHPGGEEWLRVPPDVVRQGVAVAYTLRGGTGSHASATPHLSGAGGVWLGPASLFLLPRGLRVPLATVDSVCVREAADAAPTTGARGVVRLIVQLGIQGLELELRPLGWSVWIPIPTPVHPMWCLPWGGT